jgi:TPR repeat protein
MLCQPVWHRSKPCQTMLAPGANLPGSGAAWEYTVELISLAAAITLTEWSERTFWRRFADGSVKRETESGGNGKSMVHLESIEAHITIPLAPGELTLAQQADRGDPAAQNDLALIFLASGKTRGAIYWLELAARQEYADAMHWLARCYLDGNGVAPDDHVGLMWLSKAAAHGHLISQGQLQVMRDRFTA